RDAERLGHRLGGNAAFLAQLAQLFAERRHRARRSRTYSAPAPPSRGTAGAVESTLSRKAGSASQRGTAARRIPEPSRVPLPVTTSSVRLPDAWARATKRLSARCASVCVMP